LENQEWVLFAFKKTFLRIIVLILKGVIPNFFIILVNKKVGLRSSENFVVIKKVVRREQGNARGWLDKYKLKFHIYTLKILQL
jgi:hypothetical protein